MEQYAKYLEVSKHMNIRETKIAEAIKSAREIQEFLWGEQNNEWGIEEWLRMFRKRIVKIEEIDPCNPHLKVELKKRILQLAACAVSLLEQMEKRDI